MFDKIKKNLKSFFLVIFAIFVLLGVLLFRMLTPKQITDNSTNKETTTTEGKHQNFLDDNFYSNILLEGKGNNKSGHYINVLSDYSCPWSSKFYNETITEFLKTGDLSNVWLQYDFLVLNEKSPSLLPTEGAYCANEQGKFWQFHDQVFKLKDKFDKIEDAFSEKNISDLARSLNIYNEQYTKCMSDHKYRQLITMRANYYLDVMEKLGVPSTFLNGKPITLFIDGKDQAVGAIDINIFTQKIQTWLKTK